MESKAAPAAGRSALSYADLLRLFLPLSLSDTIMVLAGPLIGAVLSRLPDPATQLAAYGVALAVAFVVESPIVMVLHAATALAGDPPAYRRLGRLVWLWNGALTALHGALAFTPAYGWATEVLLGLPADVARAARPAFGLLLFWTAAIGWRRYLQGLLIHHRRSGQVAAAGLVRMGALAGGLLAAAAAGQPGAICAAVGLQVSVVAEALAVAWAVRRLRPALAAAPPPGAWRAAAAAPADLGSLFWWYLPLAGSQVLVWLARPLFTAGIARAGLAAASLAAWPVAWSTVNILANATRMVQQLTITLSRDRDSFRRLRNFSLAAGLGATGLMAAVAFSAGGPAYLRAVIGLPDDLVAVALPAFQVAVLYPLLVAVQNWLQGLLVQAGQTGRVNLGALGGGAATLAFLFAGALGWQLPGAPLAAAAANLGMTIELGLLWAFTAGARRRLGALLPPSL